LEIPGSVGDLKGPKIYSKLCMKLINWNFQRGGGGVIGQIPFMGEGVWIFSGTTQCKDMALSIMYSGSTPLPLG